MKNRGQQIFLGTCLLSGALFLLSYAFAKAHPEARQQSYPLSVLRSLHHRAAGRTLVSVDETHSLDLKGVRELRLEGVAWDVQFVCTQAKELKVHLSGKLRVEKPLEPGKALAIDRSGDQLHLRSPDLDQGGDRGLSINLGDEDLKDGLRLRVEVPADFKGVLDSKSVAGEVRIDETPRGLVELEVESVSGDIKARSASTELKRLKIKSVSGDVEFTGRAHEAEADSVSGELKVELKAPVQRLKLKTISGEVSLGLAAEQKGKVEARSLSGEVEWQGHRHGAKEWEEVLGAGDNEIQIRTTSGDIRIRVQR